MVSCETKNVLLISLHGALSALNLLLLLSKKFHAQLVQVCWNEISQDLNQYHLHDSLNIVIAEKFDLTLILIWILYGVF